MPELPFLQVLAENLDGRVRGRTITAAALHSPSLLRTVDPPLQVLAGRRIDGVRRIAKLIVLELSGELALVLHLMRDGRVQLRPPRRPGKDLALQLHLDGGQAVQVVEPGPKKRASAYVLRAAALGSQAPFIGLGLDPLEAAFSPERLGAMLVEEPAQLKRFLTGQRHLTGIGNAYADEILWEARLSPFLPGRRAGADQVAALHQAIRRTLARALDEHRAHFGDGLPAKEPRDLLRVHRHGGEPCPRCGTRIAEVAYEERATHYCPACQTGGRVYADRRLSRLLK